MIATGGWLRMDTMSRRVQPASIAPTIQMRNGDELGIHSPILGLEPWPLMPGLEREFTALNPNAMFTAIASLWMRWIYREMMNAAKVFCGETNARESAASNYPIFPLNPHRSIAGFERI